MRYIFFYIKVTKKWHFLWTSTPLLSRIAWHIFGILSMVNYLHVPRMAAACCFKFRSFFLRVWISKIFTRFRIRINYHFLIQTFFYWLHKPTLVNFQKNWAFKFSVNKATESTFRKASQTYILTWCLTVRWIKRFPQCNQACCTETQAQKEATSENTTFDQSRLMFSASQILRFFHGFRKEFQACASKLDSFLAQSMSNCIYTNTDTVLVQSRLDTRRSRVEFVSNIITITHSCLLEVALVVPRFDNSSTFTHSTFLRNFHIFYSFCSIGDF